jgi:uracil-DNA glycosylase family 4
MTSMCVMSNQQSSTLNKFLPSEAHRINSSEELANALRTRGCAGCPLGSQECFKAPVIKRGSSQARKMIIGEAPGKQEDLHGRPFCGPAGKLLDKIFGSAGWDTNTHWYVTNVVKCRPVAPPGSGKENLTPTKAHREACRPIIEREIELIKPQVIVLLGASAITGLLGNIMPSKTPLGGITGKILLDMRWPDVVFFPMYHPAYLLRKQNMSKEAYAPLRQATWAHLQTLKEIVTELEE